MSTDWYTPAKYIEAARLVMGTIDLDPASCAFANQVVQAKQYFDAQTDGFVSLWYGCVWLNPPYGRTAGKNNQAVWTAKLVEEYDSGRVTQAITLCDARTDTRWFHALFARFSICFFKGRINFYTLPVATSNTHTHGSVFIYLGPNEQRFADVFGQFGRVIAPPKPPP